MKFTLRQLEIFIVIAQYESVSKACEQLKLSQSAASTALAELERQFNCQLFDRQGKRLHLNGLGRQLLTQAVAFLDHAEEIKDLLSGRTIAGTFDLGATLTIGNYLAVFLIGQFMQLRPECSVFLHVYNTQRVIQQVVRHELDLGMIEDDCRHPDIEVEHWLEDELVVFCAPDHPLAKQKEGDIQRLMAERWILREWGSGTRQTLERALHPYKASLDVCLELEHTEAIKRAVESGLGIGCISRVSLRDAFRRGSLVPIRTPQLDLRRQFYFIWHRKKYQTAVMREFLTLCRRKTAGIRCTDELALPVIP